MERSTDIARVLIGCFFVRDQLAEDRPANDLHTKTVRNFFTHCVGLFISMDSYCALQMTARHGTEKVNVTRE